MAQTIVQYQINGSNPSTVGGTGATQKYFPNLPGPSIGVSNTTPSSSSAAGQLLVPGSNRLNGQRFTVKANGNFVVGTGGGSSTVQIELSANTGTVSSPVYTILAKLATAYTAEGLDGVYYPWSMSVDLQGDTLSGIVQGTQQILVDNTFQAGSSPAALTNSLTGINFASEPPFGLVVGITFGTSESGNSANLYDFHIEA